MPDGKRCTIRARSPIARPGCRKIARHRCFGHATGHFRKYQCHKLDDRGARRRPPHVMSGQPYIQHSVTANCARSRPCTRTNALLRFAYQSANCPRAGRSIAAQARLLRVWNGIFALGDWRVRASKRRAQLSRAQVALDGCNLSDVFANSRFVEFVWYRRLGVVGSDHLVSTAGAAPSNTHSRQSISGRLRAELRSTDGCNNHLGRTTRELLQP